MANRCAAEPPEFQLAAATTPIKHDGAFQVTIEVYAVLADDELQLQDRHLVLFKDGKAYDFALADPRDVTVIDPINAQVTLLSRVEHVKSTITNQDIVTAVARFRLFVKNEGFEGRVGIGAVSVKHPSKPNSYQIEFGEYHYDASATVPVMAMQPARFAEFNDWVARVNLVRKMGTPPFAKMNLGQTIATDGLIPKTITLNLKSATQSRTFISNYKFKDELSPESQKRFDEIAGMMTLYRNVPLEAFPR